MDPGGLNGPAHRRSLVQAGSPQITTHWLIAAMSPTCPLLPFIFHAISDRNSGNTRRWPSPTTALTPSSSSSSGVQAEVPHERADAELRARARAAGSLPLGRLPLFQFLFLSPRTGDSGCGITEDQPAEHALRSPLS